MRPNDFINKLPAGSPAGEILKIATLIAATVLADKVGEIVKDVMADDKPRLIDTTFREDN